MDETAHTGFRDRRIQPLCHLSGEAGDTLDDSVMSARDAKNARKKVGAVLGQQPALDLRAVVEPRLAEHVEHAAGGAGLRIGGRRRHDAGTRASTIAPAHIAHGSSVTYRTESSTRQLPSARAASRSAIISAWAVGSARTSRSLWPGADHLAVAHDDRADRDVVVLGCALGLAEGEAHEVLVAWEEV